ncbi:MAG: hypothetical protein RSB96_00145 [Oscillospiraceae bacterium]
MSKFTVMLNQHQIKIGKDQYAIGSSLLNFISLPITNLQNDFYNYIDRLVKDRLITVENYKKTITMWFETIEDFHPYCSLLSIYFNRCIKLFNSMVNEDTPPIELANNLKKTFYTIVLDFLECKNIYTELLNVCFFYPQIQNNFTPAMRYILFKNTTQTKFKDITLSYTLVPSQKINTPNIIDFMCNHKIELNKSYGISNVNQLCYIEFMYLLENTPTIKACEKCNDYFIPVHPDDRTCYKKGFGNFEPCSQVIKEKLALEKQINTAFENAYEKYSGLVGLHQITSHNLSNWVKNAKRVQKLCMEHKITFDQYEAIISEISVS